MNSLKLLYVYSYNINYGFLRSFAPLWNILKTSTEKLATLHIQMVQRFQELIKDIIKYSEDQHKKHKQVCSIYWDFNGVWTVWSSSWRNLHF